MNHPLALPAGTLVVALAVPWTLGGDPYAVHILNTVLLSAGLALAWNLLGMAGQVSFGHAAFFGVGAYGSGVLTTRAGLPPVVSVPLACLVAVALAVVIAVPTLRLRGPFFALGMFAYAHILGLVTLNADRLTGGGSGLSELPALGPGFLRSRTPTYYVTLAAVWALWALSIAVRRSRFGLGLGAIAQDEDAARTLGVDTTLYKSLALLLSAGATAFFGALYAHYVRFLTPGVAFAGYWSVFPMVASLFGGGAFAAGPLVGALVLGLVHEFVLAEYLQRGAVLVFGLLVVVVVIGMPGGLLGQARRWLRRARA